jgi:hypothetical protein
MGPEWAWFPAKPGENPYNGPEYYAEMVRQREVYGEAWFKRYHDGDWGSFEGQRFTMFEHKRHVMPTEFHPTNDYEILEGWDFGHRETFVVWIAYKPGSNEPVVVFDELQYKEVQQPTQVARAVHNIRQKHGIADRVNALGDPAGAAASQFSEIGPIAAYAQLGLFIAPCRVGKNPQGRADVIAKLLVENRRQLGGEIWPGLVFSPNCVHTVDSLINLRWDMRAQENGGREKFVKDNDHGFDALGYGILGVPPPGSDEPPRIARPGVATHPKAGVYHDDDQDWDEAY